IVAMLIPEFIVLWSIREWIAVRIVLKKYRAYGWTKAHAYLALMGGFSLYDEGTFKCHLWPDTPYKGYRDQEMKIAEEMEKKMSPLELQELFPRKFSRSLILTHYSCLLEFFVAKGFISIDEKYINDNLNHTDIMGKAIAIFQTSRFIMQCIARMVEDIDLTQLEVLTVAYAILNGLTYILWWNKPHR
ncbi:hypothetical protein L218DRAFT_835375, partial [Marasmius fiardii PR-910]